MKTKKYIIYILIMILLVGIFSPIAQVGAQNPGDINPETGVAPDMPTGLSGTYSQCVALSGIQGFLCKIGDILSAVIPILITLGVVYFVWGVIQYMIGTDDETKKGAKAKIIYGIIGLAVIVSVWGLVNILKTTFFGTMTILAPTVSTLGTSSSGSSCSFIGNPKPKFQDLLCYVTKIINDSVIPLLFALASAVFVWGVVQFVINSDEETKKAKGKQFMLWGIIALTVMVTVWGLVGILGKTFGLETSVIPQVKSTP